VANRIDHIFVDENFRIENSFVVYKSTNWSSLASISDHPGIFAEVTLKPAQFSEYEFWRSKDISIDEVEKLLKPKQ